MSAASCIDNYSTSHTSGWLPGSSRAPGRKLDDIQKDILWAVVYAEPSPDTPRTAADFIPYDVAAFCHAKGIRAYLDRALALARELFSAATRIDVELNTDPTGGAGKWVAVQVTTDGDIESLVKAECDYAIQWAKDVPAPARFLFALLINY